MAFLLAVFGIYLVKDGLGRQSDWNRMMSSGTQVKGTVVDHVDYQGKTRNLVVRFNANGSMIDHSFRVSDNDYFNIPNESQLDVRYLNSKPTVATLIGHDASQTPSTELLFAFIILAISAGLFCILIVMSRRPQDL